MIIIRDFIADSIESHIYYDGPYQICATMRGRSTDRNLPDYMKRDDTYLVRWRDRYLKIRLMELRLTPDDTFDVTARVVGLATDDEWRAAIVEEIQAGKYTPDA